MSSVLNNLIPFFKLVSPQQVMVIERLGRFDRLAEPGLNIIMPFIERSRPFTYRVREETPSGHTHVTHRTTHYIDLREQVLDFPKQSVITADNVVMEINAVLYYRIIDPQKAVYAIADLGEAIEKLTQTTLRNVIGELSLDDTLSSRDQINARLLAILDEATNSWGVDVTRVELQDIIPPPDVRQTMELQMTAERRKRAQLLEAEGNKQAAILGAEGQATSQLRNAQANKESHILKAEGDAEAIQANAVAQARSRKIQAEAEAMALETIAEKIGKDAAVQYMIGIKYLDSLQVMANGRSTTTFIPYEASGALGAVGTIREMLGKTESTS